MGTPENGYPDLDIHFTPVRIRSNGEMDPIIQFSARLCRPASGGGAGRVGPATVSIPPGGYMRLSRPRVAFVLCAGLAALAALFLHQPPARTADAAKPDP